MPKMSKPAQSKMVAKRPGGDPVGPVPSPVTTMSTKKVMAPQTGKMKKVAKVKGKSSRAKAVNKPPTKKTTRS